LLNRPRHVVVLLDTLRAGGAERIAVEIACVLDQSRFSPIVVATRLGGPLAATLEDARVSYVILGRKRGFSPEKYKRMHRLVQRADLIYASMYGSNMWGALLARTAHKPLVAREPTFSGVRTKRRTYGYRYWIAPAAHRIICPSAIVAQSLYDEGVPPGLVAVVANGVRVDAAVPRAAARHELGLDADDFVVGIIAQLRVEKAHAVLLRAAARLRAEGRTARVCVIGDGACRAQLLQLTTELGLDGSVVWAGERRDAKRLAAAFDVGVICSEWEGLPVASLEIMAAGVPLVATAVGALPEILSGDAGLLVAPSDDAALARAIASLIDDPGRAELIGARGRERVREKFGFDRMVREFERIFQEVVEEAAGAPRYGVGAGVRRRLGV
jgi:glycosyltransferase involved in cell wall biosynthesis